MYCQRCMTPAQFAIEADINLGIVKNEQDADCFRGMMNMQTITKSTATVAERFVQCCLIANQR